MVFTSILICHFLLFVYIFIPKTGFYKCNTAGTFFYTFLSYSILLSSFTAAFLERNFLKFQCNCNFNISFISNKFLIVYRTIWYFNWLFFCSLTNFYHATQVSCDCTILNFLLVWWKKQKEFWNITKITK